MNTNDTAPPALSGKPNGSDTLFLIFLALILVAVVWLGGINFREGQHLEDAKRNGEAWAAWLTEAGTKRMEEDFEPKACAGAGGDEKSGSTWGACVEHLLKESELKGLVNTFHNQDLQVIEKCDRGDLSTAGGIRFDNLVPTPPGSAVPMVVNPLKADDSIKGKLQIRVVICDKGGYPIKVAELEF